MNRQQRRAQQAATKNEPSSGDDKAFSADKAFDNALTHHKHGNLEEAYNQYHKILSEMPTHTGALHSMGILHFQKGDVDQAIGFYRQAITLKPDYAIAYNNLGIALRESGRPKEAIEVLSEAQVLQPDLAAIYHNLGLAFENIVHLEDAVRAYQEAIGREPENFEFYNRLGFVLQDLGRWDEAEKAFKQSIDLQPGQIQVKDKLAYILQDQGKWQEAKDYYCEITEQDPENPFWPLKCLSVVPRIMESNEQIDHWRKAFVHEVVSLPKINLNDHKDILLNGYAGSLLPIHYHGRDNDPGIKRKYASIFTNNEAYEIHDLGRHDKIQVGFLITRSHEGIFYKTMWGLLEHWDSQKVEVTLICTEESRNLLLTHLQQSRVKFLIIPTDFMGMVDVIRTQMFDIVYFWEVGSDATNYFLPFFRLAPIQCTSWGSMVSTGVPNIDYFISSKPQEEGDTASHYTETLVLLDHLPTYCARPLPPKVMADRGEFGLSDKHNIYLIPQNLVKIHPDFDAYIGGILRADPTGRVLFVHYKTEVTGNLLLERFAKTIPDVVKQIKFLPRQDYEGYLRLIMMADIALDTIYFGGGMTSLEMLGLGLPIVTQPGKYLRDRSTYACYEMMGLKDCIAYSAEEYIELAVKLGTDAVFRADVKQRIEATNNVLFENSTVIDELEQCFLDIVKQHASH